MKITRQGYPGTAISLTFMDRLLAARGRPEPPSRCSRCRRHARYFVLDWPSEIWLCPSCSRPENVTDHGSPAPRRAPRSRDGEAHRATGGR